MQLPSCCAGLTLAGLAAMALLKIHVGVTPLEAASGLVYFRYYILNKLTDVFIYISRIILQYILADLGLYKSSTPAALASQDLSFDTKFGASQSRETLSLSFGKLINLL